MLIWLHEKQVGPYMQAMHFSFAVGAFVSPVIIHSFLDSAASEDTYDNIHYDKDAIQNSFWIMAATFIPVALYLLFFQTPSRKNEQPHPADTQSNKATLDEEYEVMQKPVSAAVCCGFSSREVSIIFLTFTLLVLSFSC